MRSEGQEFALKQIKEIETNNSYALEIINIIDPDEKDSPLAIEITLYCGYFRKADGGLPLRERESFRIYIPENFPLSTPSIYATHNRFAGWPHVQWKSSLCLYQSKQTEWDPSDGMYGYMDRFWDWLEHGALNELDPTREPLHPPVAYRSDYSTSTIIPKIDTPTVTDTPWIGLAQLERINDKTLSIVDWKKESIDTPNGKYAATILLNRPFPFEYPKTMANLLSELGINFDTFRSFLQTAFLWKSDDDPFLFIIGTPMRGIKGEPNLKQHLCAWEFDELETKALKLSLNKFSTNDRLKAVGLEVEELFNNFMKDSKIRWCRIFEERREIVTRRDFSSNLNVFIDKTISIWGCGALGANIAIHLARAGVKKIILRDNDIVTPGILVRQSFREIDITYTKTASLKTQIQSINNKIEVELHDDNITNWLSKDVDWSDNSDLIIDCTASNLVHFAFELYRQKIRKNRVHIASMIVDDMCQKGYLIQLDKNLTGGIKDVFRKGLLLACEDGRLKSFADAFYPESDKPKRKLFQPEPGCSDPTFIGSSADSGALASLMLEFIAYSFSDKQIQTSAWFVTKSLSEKFSRVTRQIPNDYTTIDKINGYEIRIAPIAWNQIQAHIKCNDRINSSKIETGGMLFGQRDDMLKTVWVDYASEAPPDSECSENYFIFGIEGTKALDDFRNKQSRGLSKYVGLWHTHPNSIPFPSNIDLSGMEQILNSTDFSRKKNLLLIIQPETNLFKIGAYLFDKNDFKHRYITISNYRTQTDIKKNLNKEKNIGLSLSGGGSRAIAFHLGCLRALNDRNILDRVDVISSVSGGSIIAALFAYSDCPFSEFDRRIIDLLKTGIDTKILNEFIRSGDFIKELYNYFIKLPHSIWNRFFNKKIQLRRISYRTLCFIHILKKYWFGDKLITDNRRNNINTVINASELRTGTAFRFGSKESACWRFGKIENNNVSLAEAVALSAAYPLFLPSLDKDFKFIQNGKVESKRVVISDGGIFDNLGITCMEPGRDPKYSTNVYSPEYIICCNAGYGMLTGNYIPYGLASRLTQVLVSTMRKVQDSAMDRLHKYRESNLIKGFILPYLGQIDKTLPFHWPNLIKREEVDYPTDFRPMDENNICKLTLRGEQLTKLLIDAYCPEL